MSEEDAIAEFDAARAAWRRHRDQGPMVFKVPVSITIRGDILEKYRKVEPTRPSADFHFPKTELFFVTVRGVRCAIIEQTLDDALNIADAAMEWELS